MAQGEEEQEPVDRDQPGLFAGAPRVKRMPSYTEQQIALALKRGRGLMTHAARLLGCSPETIRKRLNAKRRDGEKTGEARRLGQLLDDLRLQLVESSESVIYRAVDPTCWECGGTGTVVIRPKFVADPEEKPCEVCGGTGWHGGKREEIDPTERRQYAWKVAQTLGRRRGWGERLDIVKIPADGNPEDLSEEEIEAAIVQLKAGVPLVEIYQSIKGKKAEDAA